MISMLALQQSRPSVQIKLLLIFFFSLSLSLFSMFFRYEHSPWSDCGQTLWTQSSGSVTHYQHGQFSDQWSDPHTTNLVTCMVTANKCRPLWVWFRRLLLSQILGKCGLLWHKKWNERLWRHLVVEGGRAVQFLMFIKCQQRDTDLGCGVLPRCPWTTVGRRRWTTMMFFTSARPEPNFCRSWWLSWSVVSSNKTSTQTDTSEETQLKVIVWEPTIFVFICDSVKDPGHSGGYWPRRTATRSLVQPLVAFSPLHW